MAVCSEGGMPFIVVNGSSTIQSQFLEPVHGEFLHINAGVVDSHHLRKL